MPKCHPVMQNEVEGVAEHPQLDVDAKESPSEVMMYSETEMQQVLKIQSYAFPGFLLPEGLPAERCHPPV